MDKQYLAEDDAFFVTLNQFCNLIMYWYYYVPKYIVIANNLMETLSHDYPLCCVEWIRFSTPTPST